MPMQFTICWTTVLNIILHLSIITCRLEHEPTEEPIPPNATETTPTPPVLDLHCFHQPEEKCPRNSTCKCQALPDHPEAVICCNIDSTSLQESMECAAVGGTGDVQALHIRNATFDYLPISTKWKRLKSLSITDGRITNVSADFKKYQSIECLNLSNNGISEIGQRAIVNLLNLTILDLSHNNITTLDNLGLSRRKLTLNISNNTPFQCTSLFKILNKEENITFEHQNETFCVYSNSFQWFNSIEKVPFIQMEHIVKLSNECPKVENKECDCEPFRFHIVPGQPSVFSVQVDCSNRNLNSLPETLPLNTILLNVSFNNITSLIQLKNENYNSLSRLYAQHNKITSIQDMEGTAFINHFIILNLRHNKLENLPVYMLRNHFDRNPKQQSVSLGKNELTCNCNTIKEVKEWLMTRPKNIPDYDEIYCNNFRDKVIDLDQSEVCQYPRDLTDYIHYIIAIEVFLFVGLILKVTYDYWIFKTTGYLPWPASKIPKLPCDWLCET